MKIMPIMNNNQNHRAQRTQKSPAFKSFMPIADVLTNARRNELFHNRHILEEIGQKVNLLVTSGEKNQPLIICWPLNRNLDEAVRHNLEATEGIYQKAVALKSEVLGLK